jgi:hypothetical protein
MGHPLGLTRQVACHVVQARRVQMLGRLTQVTNALVEPFTSLARLATLRPLGAPHHLAGLLRQPVRLIMATSFLQLGDPLLHRSKSLYQLAVGRVLRLVTAFVGAALQVLTILLDLSRDAFRLIAAALFRQLRQTMVQLRQPLLRHAGIRLITTFFIRALLVLFPKSADLLLDACGIVVVTGSNQLLYLLLQLANLLVEFAIALPIYFRRA